MTSQLSGNYQFGVMHTADTTEGKITNMALLSTESEKVHCLYLPLIRWKMLSLLSCPANVVHVSLSYSAALVSGHWIIIYFLLTLLYFTLL